MATAGYQMCPECKRHNRSGARYCIYCRGRQRGLLPRGTLLRNRYRVVDLLGCGGMGAVYLAEDRALGPQVAVKENLDPSPEGRQQFETEARILAHIRHAFLPRVQDYFISGGRQYLVMDYISGPNLEEWVESKGPLPTDQAVGLFRQVMKAVQYLHTRNPPIIHRDIKPSNIRISPSGRPYLVDFGIAKVLHWSSQTQAGARAVTPGYSPPEQYGTGTTDQRSDLYSLGATLYFACTGHHPPEAIHRITGRADRLIPPRKLNPNLSPRLEQVILKSLRLLQDDRYQSVQEVLDDLRGEKVTSLAPTHRGAPLPPARPMKAPPQKRPPRPAVPRRILASAPVVLRVGAFLIDVLFVCSVVLTSFLLWLFYWFATDPFALLRSRDLWEITTLVRSFLLAFPLYRALGHGLAGMTIGKRLIGIALVGPSGKRPGLIKSLIREAVVLLELFFLLGIPALIWTVRDPRRQCWHDIVIRTTVIKREASEP